MQRHCVTQIRLVFDFRVLLPNIDKPRANNTTFPEAQRKAFGVFYDRKESEIKNWSPEFPAYQHGFWMGWQLGWGFEVCLGNIRLQHTNILEVRGASEGGPLRLCSLQRRARLPLGCAGPGKEIISANRRLLVAFRRLTLGKGSVSGGLAKMLDGKSE